jgi:MoaA/NifB/PqqE/SkfB family radical SAM enzyme/GT2 family glycosyltransferase
MKDKDLASICIVTRNRLSTLKKCLNAIWALTEYPYEILIADNNSTDGTIKYLRSLKKRGKVHYLKLNKYNEGYSSAVNNLIYKSKKKIIITLDDDFIIKTKRWVYKLKKVVENVPNVGILGVNCENMHFKIEKINGCKLEVKSRSDIPFNIGGWCIVIPRKTFLELGYFNEEFAPYGIEDADYGLRAHLINRTNCYVCSIRGDHKCSMKSKEKRDSVINSQLLMAYNMVEYISNKKEPYLSYSQEKMSKSKKDDIIKSMAQMFDLKKLLKNDSHVYALCRIKEMYKDVKEFLYENEGKIGIVKLGYSCNNNCKVCHEKIKKNSVDFFSKKEIIKRINECHKKGIKKILLSGGEPTINKNLFSYLNLIKKLDMYAELISNGRVFSYKEFCNRVSKEGICNVYVSIYSSRKDIHDAVTGVSGSYKQTLNGIKNLLQTGINVRLRLIITKKNIDHLKESVNFFNKMGVKEIMLVNLEPKGNALDNFDEYFIPLKKVSSEIKGIIKILPEIRILVENIPFCYLGPKYKKYYTKVQEDIQYVFRDKLSNPNKLDDGYHFYLPKCKKCLYKNKECRGIFKDYPRKLKIEVYPIN